MTPAKPLSVLHVLGVMDRGGAETWLMHVLRNMDHSRFRFDFLVHTEKPGAYDNEILSYGSRILPCLAPQRPWAYSRRFAGILGVYGPYDVIHSHVHHFSGFVLRLAHKGGVRGRIAHSHSDTRSIDNTARLHRRLYLDTMKLLIRNHATEGLAASALAASSLFGPQWRTDSRWRVSFCGIDLSPFRSLPPSTEVRIELGIPENAIVLGHVGRFTDQKNQSRLLDIAVELASRDFHVWLLLVGDGPLRTSVEKRAVDLGVADRVFFAGVRTDVHRMLATMDVFVFPSFHEGLPLALLEAQAAGLPCVFSDSVAEEADVVQPLLKRVSLSQPSSLWAGAVLAALETRSSPSRSLALPTMEHSAFSIRGSIADLETVYEHYRS